MTALTDDFLRDSKSPRILDLEVKTAVKIFKGAMVAVDAATGYALPAANTSGYIFQGIARDRADNTDGASGEITVVVDRPARFSVILASAAITDIGLDVYVADDNTVTKTVGNGVYVGKVVALLGTNLVEVQPIYSRAIIASAIADTGALVGPTFTSHAWDGSTYPTQAEGDKIVADFGTYKTAIDALNATQDSILAALRAAGIVIT
jgi:hypothetical protein